MTEPTTPVAAPARPPSFAARVATSAVLLALLVLVNLPQLDNVATDYTDRLMKRALIAFAVARGVDSAISMAQGTEVALQPAGLGLTLTPGELLDPVNDMVEQLCDVLMWAAAAAGMQKLLLVISGWGWLTGVLSALLLLYGVGVWWRRMAFMRPLAAVLGVLLVLRLAVPGIALANEAVYQLFLEDPYEASRSSLAVTKDEVLSRSAVIDEVARGQPPADALPPGSAPSGFLDRAQAWIAGAGAALDPRPQMRALQASADRAVEDTVQLIALFMLQTVVLPLLFLWLLQRFLRWILRDV